MPAPPEYTFLVDLFTKTSELAMREAGLAAANVQVERWTGPVPVISELHWRRELLQVLAPHLPRQSTAAGALATDHLADQQFWAAANGHMDLHQFAVRSFWQWMERAGLALRFDAGQWVITPAGQRRLKSDHPCRPGAMERLRSAFATEHEDSLKRLDDALDCLDAGLPRPAVVLLGLAYEELIGAVLARVTGKAVDQLSWKASVRQAELRQAIESQAAKGTKEMRERALVALNVADTIRDKRNDAAHRAAGDWDSVEADELVSSGIGAYAKIAGYTP